MKSSAIIDSSVAPLSPLSRSEYTTKSKEILDAARRSGADVRSGLVSASYDTSQYEFPGDVTYARYRAGV